MTNRLTLPGENEMYRALVEKEGTCEGIFFAAIRTTGIFCRPSCRARKPRCQNVEFFATARAALQHGYRPCKVCALPIYIAAPFSRWFQKSGQRLTIFMVFQLKTVSTVNRPKAFFYPPAKAGGNVFGFSFK